MTWNLFWFGLGSEAELCLIVWVLVETLLYHMSVRAKLNTRQ
jgi:hypothetical protein